MAIATFIFYFSNSYEINKNVKIYQYPCTDESECYPYELEFIPGIYQIELWGAQGGDARYLNEDNFRPNSGGKGAYVKGTIEFQQKTKLYLYIGGKGEDQKYTDSTQSKGGYNGGGKGGVETHDETYPESGAGGGGSTDLRLLKGESEESLKSRIIVAGAGGGGCSTNSFSPRGGLYQFSPYGGSGGGLIGENITSYGFGGNQTHGIFGKGGDGFGNGDDVEVKTKEKIGSGSGGCGSGYYGGYIIPPTNNINFEFGGSGGSSFISGHKGCIAIQNVESKKLDQKDLSIHYSNLYFNDTVMKTKFDEDFVDPYGKLEQGHSGNGCAKITRILEKRKTNNKPVARSNQFFSHIFF